MGGSAPSACQADRADGPARQPLTPNHARARLGSTPPPAAEPRRFSRPPQAAVEEDIANNIWDPTHIPEKIRQKVMAEEAEKEAAIASIMASAKGAIA